MPQLRFLDMNFKRDLSSFSWLTILLIIKIILCADEISKNFFKKIVENSVSANDMMKWELLEK